MKAKILIGLIAGALASTGAYAGSAAMSCCCPDCCHHEDGGKK